MTHKSTGAMAIWAVVVAISMFHAARTEVRAQAGRSTADGVYTEAQAKRGETTYSKECAVCHGGQLEGAEGPSLTGKEFEMFWKGVPVSDLFDRIKTTMPQSAPGSLTPEQSVDVAAFILSKLMAPAGTTELPAKVDELKQIVIGAPK